MLPGAGLAEGMAPGGPPAGELVCAERLVFAGLPEARLRQVTGPGDRGAPSLHR